MSDKTTRPGQPVSPSPGQQTLTIQQALDLAVQHHTAGRLPEAESIYQQILQSDSNQPVALHLLGVIAHQVGKNDTAVASYHKALTIKPDYADAHSNLGLALRAIAQSGVWHLIQAATRSVCVTSTPSLNFTPVISLVK